MMLSVGACSGKVHLTVGLNENEMMKVSGNVVPMSLAKLLLAEERNSYSTQYGQDIWNVSIDGNDLVSEVKKNIKHKLSELVTISLLAKDKNVSLSKSEKENIEKAAKAYVGCLTDEEKESLGVTWQDVNLLYEYFLFTMKLYEMTSNSVNVEISDEDARVIKIQYCYLKKNSVIAEKETTSQNEDAEGSNATAIINKVYNELMQGKSISVIAKEYSEIESFECETGRGKFANEFDEVVFELENGEISRIIETKEGYYIVKCLNSYNEEKTNANKIALLEKHKEKAFKEIYEPFINKQLFEYNDKDYNNIDITSLVLDNNDLYGVFKTYISD
jgi:foldase protein PrsA